MLDYLFMECHILGTDMSYAMDILKYEKIYVEYTMTVTVYTIYMTT